MGSRANPSAPWTCGWLSERGDACTPYKDWGVTTDGSHCWWDGRGVGVAGIVSSPWLDEKSPLAGRPWLVLHPGAGGERAALRWTAPVSGSVKVTVAFGGVSWGQPTSTEGRVSLNGSVEFASPVLARLKWQAKRLIHLTRAMLLVG